MNRYYFVLIIALTLMTGVVYTAEAQQQGRSMLPPGAGYQGGQLPTAQQAPIGATTTYAVQPSLEGTMTESRYTLGASDVIEVEVIRHPEVSGQYILNKEGYIQYEFLGDVEISGMTKKEVAAKLKEKLEEYIISPELTVKIVGYNSKVIYVIGEVGRPGKIFMQGDEMTVREALIQAGLPTLTAKTSKSTLITPSEDGKGGTKNVNVKKLLYEGDLRENLVMRPGDTLFIPPTAMAKAMRVIQPIAAPITTAAGAGRTVYTGGF